MPIYEYRCASCGHEKEVLQKLSDPPLTKCPACGKAALEKLVSAAGFHLKGSGWYATDFKGGAKPKEGSQEAQDKSASKDKQESQSQPKETKEAKEDAKAGKEPSPTTTTTTTKAPLPAAATGKADQ
ncbi:MAG TPA: FmdB family zinc ribbon protein [Burkholderiales bacterium]|jgi:putative FmdB family regulatory protein|nr:FmdB family zinc ribbon protein [Burkholderiales bacterium]